MKKPAVAVAALLILFLVAIAWAIGEKAQDFTLIDFSGKTFNLSSAQAKVKVVSFWMSWCKPCMVEMPFLQTLYDQKKDKGLLIISICGDDPSGLEKAKAIVAQKNLTYPVLHDPSSKVIGQYNPKNVFPYTVVIDSKGVIRSVHTGFSKGADSELTKIVDQLLAE